MKKNAIWLQARGSRFQVSGHHILGEMDFNPSWRHHPIRAITSLWVLEKSRSEVDDFRRFWTFFGLKTLYKMIVVCMVQNFQSNLFWKPFMWHKRQKNWRNGIMGKNKVSFVNESRIWLSIVVFQFTLVIKGIGKKLFFKSFDTTIM